VIEFETEAGPADYALWDHNEALGVVEAKKVTLGPQGVLTQAERYSRGFTANPVDYGEGFRVPSERGRSSRSSLRCRTKHRACLNHLTFHLPV
jgi:hypothetical protein